VNSCINGLLCLFDPINENPLVVCNPVIGEFMTSRGNQEYQENSKTDMIGYWLQT